jgi:hypothetical protein
MSFRALFCNLKQYAQLLGACFFFCSMQTAWAAGGLSPFEAPITSPADFQTVIDRSFSSREQTTTVEPFAPILFTTQIKTLGNVTFTLNREWRVPDVSFADNGFALQQLDRDGVHLQGYAELRLLGDKNYKSKQKVPAAASIYGAPGNIQLIEAVFFAGVPGENGHFYKVTAQLTNGSTLSEARAVRISESAFQGRTCGLLSNQAPAIAKRLSASTSKPPRTAPLSYLSFDISTEADFEYFSAHGSRANAKIQAILNQVQTIYKDQLGLTFSLVKQVVMTSRGTRYTSFNIEALLENFRGYTESRKHLGSADLYHLFTGKNTFFIPEGSTDEEYAVIGLAYVGVVCAFADYSYGLSEDFNVALNHITVAHEIGHNFSAQHDAAGTIMGTVLNLSSPPTQFSNFSKSQIGSHVSANSSCLTNSDGSPTPPGGNTPGGGSDQVQFNVSLSTKGSLNVSVTLASVDSTCNVKLLAASNSGRVFSGTEIISSGADFMQTTYENVVINRKTATIANKLQRVHLGVVKTCGDLVYYSAVKSVAPYRIKSSRAGLPLKAWIRLMARQVRAATPVQS